MNLQMPVGDRGWIEERGFGMDRYTLPCLKLTVNQRTYGIAQITQCYVAAWMGEEFVGEWIHVYIWLSPFTVHLKLSQYC